MHPPNGRHGPGSVDRERWSHSLAMVTEAVQRLGVAPASAPRAQFCHLHRIAPITKTFDVAHETCPNGEEVPGNGSDNLYLRKQSGVWCRNALRTFPRRR